MGANANNIIIFSVVYGGFKRGRLLMVSDTNDFFVFSLEKLYKTMVTFLLHRS